MAPVPVNSWFTFDLFNGGYRISSTLDSIGTRIGSDGVCDGAQGKGLVNGESDFLGSQWLCIHAPQTNRVDIFNPHRAVAGWAARVLAAIRGSKKLLDADRAWPRAESSTG